MHIWRIYKPWCQWTLAFGLKAWQVLHGDTKVLKNFPPKDLLIGSLPFSTPSNFLAFLEPKLCPLLWWADSNELKDEFWWTCWSVSFAGKEMACGWCCLMEFIRLEGFGLGFFTEFDAWDFGGALVTINSNSGLWLEIWSCCLVWFRGTKGDLIGCSWMETRPLKESESGEMLSAARTYEGGLFPLKDPMNIWNLGSEWLWWRKIFYVKVATRWRNILILMLCPID